MDESLGSKLFRELIQYIYTKNKCVMPRLGGNQNISGSLK